MAHPFSIETWNEEPELKDHIHVVGTWKPSGIACGMPHFVPLQKGNDKENGCVENFSHKIS